MFSIRAIWADDKSKRNSQRIFNASDSLKEAAANLRAAADALEAAEADIKGDVLGIVTGGGLEPGQAQNVASFVGGKVAEAARKAYQASENATEAVVYVAGLEAGK